MGGLKVVVVNHLPALARLGDEARAGIAGLGHRTHGTTVYRERIRILPRSNRRLMVGPVTPHFGPLAIGHGDGAYLSAHPQRVQSCMTSPDSLHHRRR